MRVGVPKEIKNNEFRVGLTPGSVREYVANGHKVFVEKNAGIGINATDKDYKSAGATILKTAAEVFAKSDMIVKVKEPQPVEWKQLREGQILYTYLHLAPDPAQTKGLIESGCTAVAYETVTDNAGGLPLLAPMSEVAGRLSIQAAATALQKPNGGRGKLMGGVPGVAPANVVVIGGGVVGTHAAKMAVGLGASVTILDRSLPRLRELDDLFGGRVITRYSTADALGRMCYRGRCRNRCGTYSRRIRAQARNTQNAQEHAQRRSACAMWQLIRAVVSKPPRRQPMPNQPMKLTASFTIAWRTCRALCP